MSKEWIITIEGNEVDKDILEVSKYFKISEDSFEMITYHPHYGELQETFVSSSAVVESVFSKLKGSFRVKEMPYKYGNFWRKSFEKKGLNYWSEKWEI